MEIDDYREPVSKGRAALYAFIAFALVGLLSFGTAWIFNSVSQKNMEQEALKRKKFMDTMEREAKESKAIEESEIDRKAIDNKQSGHLPASERDIDNFLSSRFFGQEREDMKRSLCAFYQVCR